MRRHIKEATEPYVLFVEDCEEGGCIIECPYCKEHFNEKGLEDCPNPKCAHDIVFPTWTDW